MQLYERRKAEEIDIDSRVLWEPNSFVLQRELSKVHEAPARAADTEENGAAERVQSRAPPACAGRADARAVPQGSEPFYTATGNLRHFSSKFGSSYSRKTEASYSAGLRHIQQLDMDG
ncbi:hypothetical protein AOLI_G00096050 [Acnodon oligacanthus]